MMKVLIALASLLALSAGQLNTLTNTQELDPAGNFRLNWEVLPESGDIVLEIVANATGWVSLEIVTDDGKYADVIFGGYNDEFSFGYVEDWSLEWTPGAHLLPIPDASKDIVLQTASFAAPTTTLRVKRSLNTGDYYDVPFHSGQMPIGWSYSTSDAYDSVHAAAGFAYVTFY
ncbi:DBH-like monooxygenase protein 2 homolog isoform X4 [Daphnia pulicaria]|nr:DBH-like monooxygenase protein 2 homolog isoform X4 [Daphnia pulicaria]